MRNIRTDLALESGALFDGGSIEGVDLEETKYAGWNVTRVRVRTNAGAQALGKPRGTYLTLDLRDFSTAGADALPRGVEAVGACLKELLPHREGCALVIGLGNRAVTPDAVGPRCVDRVLVTRHLHDQMPGAFDHFFPVAALATGVLGTTGIESGAVVAALCRELKPAFVLAVDALAARSVHRLCTTIQISDTGIIPGSGVGNARTALNEETLGVPVLALGIPTVVDGGTMAQDLEGVLVTPKDIDALVTQLSQVVGYGINAGLQEGLSVEEMDYLLR